MARQRKTPSRIELRKAAEAAEKDETSSDGKKKAAKKATKATKAPKKKRKATKKKSKANAAPERLRLVWGVFDNSNQQIAAFPFPNRKDAEKKVEDMAGKGKGPYFIQPVKEPIIEEEAPEDEAAEG